MVQYASITCRDAYLSGEFGESYARKLFGNAAIDSLPRISRGKRKGALKGQLQWQKCEIGGWYRDGARGRVVYPGFNGAQVVINGRIVLTTSYSSFEKKVAAEAIEAARQVKDQDIRDMERAEDLWFKPSWPRMELPSWRLA